MLIWKFLHVAAMFGAVAFFVGQGILSERIVSSQDVPAIRRTLATEARLQPLGGIFLLLGLGFGFATAATGGFGLTDTWLIISYVLVVLLILTGFLYHGPRSGRLKALADSSPDDTPSDELRSEIEAPRARLVTALDSLIWLAVIFTMVVKPFS